MIESLHRGHPIVFKNDEWFYKDNGESVKDTHDKRPCGHCDKKSTDEGRDACLGTLPGVMNACCGHGVMSQAYIQFDNGVTIRGFNIDDTVHCPRCETYWEAVLLLDGEACPKCKLVL